MTQSTPSTDKHIPLTRENLRSGRIREWIKQHDPSFEPMSDEDVTASRHAMFGGKAPDRDVWLFGYGSLIWNPSIEFEEKRKGTVHGLHRTFCLETHLGRGSPEFPGLMLALDRGGSCRGVVFRIPGKLAEEELDLVWRREMVSNAYRPTWLTVKTEKGPVKAIGFVINRSHHRYCGAKSDEIAAETIAKARGFLGPCCEYLFNTVSHLEELGIPDAGLARLAKRVERVQSRNGSAD
jgi:cation transport protein ChaC